MKLQVRRILVIKVEYEGILAIKFGLLQILDCVFYSQGHSLNYLETKWDIP